MTIQPNDREITWNSSERRIGIDCWPEAQAEVIDIDQLYDPKHSFLSAISFTFKDGSGAYFTGKFHMRTVDLPDNLMTGSTVTIRYDAKNPQRSWSEYDYYRAGIGRFQSFDYPIAFVSLFLLLVLLIGVVKLFHLGPH